MAARTVKTKESLDFGWQTWKANPWFLIGVTILLFLLPGLPAAISYRPNLSGSIEAVLVILSWALSLIMSIGMIKITLALIDGGKPTWNDLFIHSRYLLRYLGASILYSLMVTAGLILLIIPGIYWALKYQFAVYLIVDKDMGIFAAFKRSGELTTGIKWPLLGYGLLQLVINWIGALLLGVGLLVTVPVTMLAYAKIYRELEKEPLSDAQPIQP